VPTEPEFSAEVFERAAARPEASPRLTRAAGAVADGKFSWEDVASGTCEHPLALALFSPAAKETVWPLLVEVAAEPAPARPRRAPVDDDEDYSEFTYLEQLDEPPTHPQWPHRDQR
jgi:hypothetical protein